MEKINLYLSMLLNGYITIAIASERMQIAVESVRKDFMEMISSPVLRNYFHIYADDRVYNLTGEESEEDEIFIYPLNLEELLTGRLDDLEFFLEPVEMGLADDTYFLPLTAEEQQLKGLDAVDEKIHMIHEAIERNKGIRLDRISLNPHHMFFNIEEMLNYVVDTRGQVYRLDKFRSCRIIERVRERKRKKKDFVEYMWGIGGSKPVDVRLEIIRPTQNLMKRFREDTALRKFGKLEGYIYTDTIVDTKAFRRWLRSYGSSVIVLEPQFLIDEICHSAERVLDMYREDEWTEE